MAKRRSKSTGWGEFVARIFLLATVLGFGPLVTFWQSIPSESRIILLVLLILALLAGIGSVWAFAEYRKRQRAAAWKRAMAAWNASAASNMPGQTAKFMSAEALEQFAAKVYAKMGYNVKHIGHTGDHGIDVYLVHPQGGVELVQCKQWRKPVGEPEVRDLYGAMGHERAVRGWLWAPNGFSENAKRWAHKKPIVLADDKEIGKLIQAAFGDK